MVDIDKGKESKWNEAQWKSKRLHDIQERINFLKSDPLGMLEGRFKYDMLVSEICSLYGEGHSKYSDDEKKEVDMIMKVVNNQLKFMPPHIKTRIDTFGESKTSYKFIQKNFDMLMDYCYKFEMRVKDLNDEHGLTTENKSEDEGL